MSLIVAIGGTTRPGSSTERALAIAAQAAQVSGAELLTFDGAYLAALPHYFGPGHAPGMGGELVEAVRAADGILIATPGYHGTISGLVKNGIDYLEDLARDERRPYLSGRPVGLIVTAYGHQAAMSSMLTLRTIAHALRGWPTPFGAALKVEKDSFDADGNCTDEAMRGQLVMVGQQVASAAGKLG
jgi:FMN reductase